MRSFAGLVLLLLGVGVGAHAYYPDTFDKHVHLAKLGEKPAPNSIAMSRYGGSEASGRTFSPGARLIGGEPPLETGSIKTVVQPAKPLLTAAPKVVARDGWNARVVQTATDDRASQYTARGAGKGAPANRWRLVRQLQKELRRVGCYDGRIDGSWGAGSKYAIRAFMQSVNSGLPTDAPDHFMLSLLKAQRGQVCGVNCNPGYRKSANGRCLPNATLAKGPTPASKRTLAGLKHGPVPAVKLVRRDGFVAERTAQGQPLPAPAANVVRKTRRQVPDGMMAVGAPMPNAYSPRGATPGVAGLPPITSSVPKPLVARNPSIGITVAPPRKAKTKRNVRKKKAKRYRARARKVARRRALMRQAFGEDF